MSRRCYPNFLMAQGTVALSLVGSEIRETLYKEPDTNPLTDHLRDKLINIQSGATKVQTSDDIFEGSSNLFFTEERVDDRVNELLTAGSNINFNYDDNGGTLTINASQPNILVDSVNSKTGDVVLDTDEIAEGINRLYFTKERVDDRVADLLVPGTNIAINYDDATGKLRIDSSSGGSGGGSISDTNDLAEGSKNLYFTEERVDDRVNALLTGGNNITLNYDDNQNILTIDSVDIEVCSVNGKTGDVVIHDSDMVVVWDHRSSGFTAGDSDNGLAIVMNTSQDETVVLDDSPTKNISFMLFQGTAVTTSFASSGSTVLKPAGASVSYDQAVKCFYDMSKKTWWVTGRLDSNAAISNANLANVYYDDGGTLKNVDYKLVAGGTPANVVYQIPLP